MLTNLKVWIYGLIGAVVAFAIGLIKLLTYQRNTARKDAEIAEKNYQESQALNEVNQQISESIKQSRKEAQEHESKIDTSKRPDPDARFDDPRLRR